MKDIKKEHHFALIYEVRLNNILNKLLLEFDDQTLWIKVNCLFKYNIDQQTALEAFIEGFIYASNYEDPLKCQKRTA